MRKSRFARSALMTGGILGVAVMATACSAPVAEDGPVEITYLTQNNERHVNSGNAMIEAFEAENPDITVRLETRIEGTEGANLVMTKLATGEMEDVFWYNSGSLFNALNPDDTLVDLSDQPWAGDLTDAMRQVVSTDEGLYGAPWSATQAGAIVYSKTIYDELGLDIPTTWAEFADNNDAIAAAGLTALMQTYGDAYSSQILILGDFANVAAQDPDWAEEYTAGERKFAEQPALQGFENLQAVYESGWLNVDFASATVDDGIRRIAEGEAAHFPILTGIVAATIQQNYPELLSDVGVFPIPAQDAADTSLTVWMPQAVYIPRTTEGAKLEAAKRFVAFVNSTEGCAIQLETLIPSGPLATTGCELPADSSDLVRDINAWFEEGKVTPALEFLSPIKGPNLANLAVEVGSGIRSAADAAALYDEDVKKQALQLGLEGWE